MSKRDPLTTNVVLCRWRQTKEGWEIWVKGCPEVRACGGSYEEAEKSLIDAIMHAAPDLDAVIPVVPEYEPPLPPIALAEQYLNPELYVIRGDEIFDVGSLKRRDIESEECQSYCNSLFTAGICPSCHKGRGQRTSVPLRVIYASPRVDAAWARAPFHSSLHLYSERFTSLLTIEERIRVDFRPIEMPPRARRRFFELSGTPDVTLVHPKALEADGLECPACGNRSLRSLHPHLMEGGMHLVHFVCLEDLPNPLPGLFVVGDGNDLHLCATRSRWDELRESGHARGIMSARIGVVREEACERKPRICNSREFCQICREWPEPRALDERMQAVFSWPADMCAHHNFAWLAQAHAEGYLQYSMSTSDPDGLWDYLNRGEPPKRTEFISFRCPKCWRLGWILLDRRELSLAWQVGLW